MYNGAPGFAWGMAAGKVFTVIVWWGMFRQALRELLASTEPQPTGALPSVGLEDQLWEEAVI
jgi:hypothetical protein